MSDKHLEAFKSFADRALEEFKTVKEVKLFGSVARGEHGARSDVDILVIVQNRSEAQEIEEMAFRKATEHGVSITPLIKTEVGSSRFLEETEKGDELVRS